MVRLTSSKVSSRRVLVSLHDREPFSPRDVVGVNGSLSSFEDRDGFLGSHEDGETWRDSESFLSGSDDDLSERSEKRVDVSSRGEREGGEDGRVGGDEHRFPNRLTCFKRTDPTSQSFRTIHET